MKVQLARAHLPVTVLGHGRRIGLWFQGCSVGCPGCVALDTWAPDEAKAMDVGALAAWCTAGRENIDGVTISGGEPFDQPAALLELLGLIRPWADEGGRDLLCYSGRALGTLRRDHQPILDMLDAVIPGPFIAARAPGALWRGSANQELVALTAAGHARYDRFVDHPADRARMQAVVDGESIHYVGVPRPGDLEAIEAALERRGVRQREVSWRS